MDVALREHSPHDGWMYFSVAFESGAMTRDQVSKVMVAAGAQIIEGPP